MDYARQADFEPTPARAYRVMVVLALLGTAAILGFLFSNPASAPSGDAVASTRHRCVTAQVDLHTLELGSRVYIVDEEGQRSFREDSDRPAAIELAKARITRYCP
jgi:hypothetical protein